MNITGTTKILGIIGHPIEHSLSPIMHNAAFEYYGLDYCYVPFVVPPQALSSAISGLKALQLKGFNVTIPHKEQVMYHLDEVTEAARNIGAVNTVVLQDQRLVGYNTDGIGFVESMRHQTEMDPKGRKILLLGAGGAAKAVAVALAMVGAREITVINRNVSKAQELARTVHQATKIPTRGLEWTEENLQQVLPRVDIVINTTPIGMFPHHDVPSAISPEYLHKDQLICDLIYNPLETTLLKEAKLKGCQVLSGWGMLLYQGAEGFRLWTGMEPPVDIMEQALLQELHKRFGK